MSNSDIISAINTLIVAFQSKSGSVDWRVVGDQLGIDKDCARMRVQRLLKKWPSADMEIIEDKLLNSSLGSHLYGNGRDPGVNVSAARSMSVSLVDSVPISVDSRHDTLRYPVHDNLSSHSRHSSMPSIPHDSSPTSVSSGTYGFQYATDGVPLHIIQQQQQQQQQAQAVYASTVPQQGLQQGIALASPAKRQLHHASVPRVIPANDLYAYASSSYITPISQQQRPPMTTPVYRKSESTSYAVTLPPTSAASLSLPMNGVSGQNATLPENMELDSDNEITERDVEGARMLERMKIGSILA
ncbi:uncharacterized protein V1518DRAFT_211457 [Limtongia smithiae]|uniref:uncharacterized protein n=1 Tax=Limtongia smithiae TaxID=1125753 RepID=UPI0034CFFD18